MGFDAAAYCERVIELSAGDDLVAVSDFALGEMDDALWASRFVEIDDCLHMLDVTRINSTAMLAILCATQGADAVLPTRAAFVGRVHAEITRVHGEAHARECVSGLA